MLSRLRLGLVRRLLRRRQIRLRVRAATSGRALGYLEEARTVAGVGTVAGRHRSGHAGLGNSRVAGTADAIAWKAG
jgi:hypothetical protein